MTKNSHALKIAYFLLVFAIIANIAFWTKSHTYKTEWPNVPPAPSFNGTSLITLGDEQLAYRLYATILQNLGSETGRAVSLAQYDYDKLVDWLNLLYGIDSQSNAVPMMAAYYFGAVKDKERVYKILDYLAVVGQSPKGEKWRWLGHAVFLARHELDDNKKALELAYLLAANKSPDLADWAKQMPVFILQEEGKPELAYQIMLNMLISNIDTLHPNEINFMKDYICNTILKEPSTIQKPEFCGLPIN